MAKKKKEEGIAEETELQEQQTDDIEGLPGPEDGAQPSEDGSHPPDDGSQAPENGEYQEGDPSSEAPPYVGNADGEAFREGAHDDDAPPGDGNFDGEVPGGDIGGDFPIEYPDGGEYGGAGPAITAGNDLYGADQLAGDHGEELFPASGEEDGDLPGVYGALGEDDPNDDPYGEGDGPPQFDLPSLTNPPEGALLLGSDGPFTEEELRAAAALFPAGADTGALEADPVEPAAAPRKRRTRAAGTTNTLAEEASPAPAARRPRNVSSTSGVLSIDEDLKVQSSEDKDALLWMELRGSMRSKRILTGILGGVERSPAGGCIAVVYYKDQRIVIPAEEMFIDIGIHQTESRRELQNRYAQILTRNLGAEMDFIISGIDRRGNSVVASRKDAMIRKQINYYHPSARRRTPIINEGMIVEARVISVGTKNIRVEVFGAETTIWARYVAWEWVEDCSDYFQVGGRVLVKVMTIDRTNPERLMLAVSIRDCFENPAQENIEKCHTQGKYIGKVTGMDTRAIYVRLNVGVNGIATACHDRKVPGRKDDVSFVVTKLDKEQGVAIGIITKIIKQHF